MDGWTVTGTIASVGGLIVGIWVLIVAKGARKAARAAQASGRRRDLVEELESASEKIQQVGNFIQQEQWEPVRMRTEEILKCCRTTLNRWPDHLSEQSRNQVMRASTLMHSIAGVIAGFGRAPITEQQRRTLSEVQMRASDHISSALGEARREQERDGGVNDGN